jgi:type I restriction enzyme S subunit
MSEMITTEASGRSTMLPAGWSVRQLRDIVPDHRRVTYGIVQPGIHEPQGVLLIRGQDYIKGWAEPDEFFRVARPLHEIFKRSTTVAGDLLICIVGATTGATNIVPAWIQEANITQTTARIACDLRRADAYFVLFTLASEIGQRQVRKYVKGSAQPGMNLADVECFHIPMPPLPQQRKIARILTTLDNVIAQTEALIAKYQAIKQGLMHDLFTRGVDATGKLRPPQSEAPELYKAFEGRFIPASWRIASLSEFADVSGGVTLGRDISGTGMISLPYLRVANVQDGYVDLSEIKFVEILKSEIDRYALCSGDVLMTEGGDFDKLGRGTVWKGQIAPCLHQNHVFRVRPLSTELNSDYLSHLTASTYGRNYFLMCAKQTTNLASINATQVKAFPLILPSPEEQRGIVGHIAAIDKMLSTERARIHKARSTKIGLMQDLLTGKVRVNVEVGMENDEGEGGMKNGE